MPREEINREEFKAYLVRARNSLVNIQGACAAAICEIDDILKQDEEAADEREKAANSDIIIQLPNSGKTVKVNKKLLKLVKTPVKQKKKKKSNKF